MHTTLKLSKSTSSGFTLVEVVVAGFLLVIFVGGALGVLIQTSRTTQLVRQRTMATTLAWSRVERIRHLSFDEMEDMAEPESGTRLNASGLPDQDGDYLRVTRITLEEEEGIRMNRIEILIRSLNPRSGEFSGEPQVIETLIADIPKSWESS
jgi:hypothetical protein